MDVDCDLSGLSDVSFAAMMLAQAAEGQVPMHTTLHVITYDGCHQSTHEHMHIWYACKCRH